MNRKVVYYHGCFVNYFDQKTGRAVVRILEKNRFKVEVPDLVCCGFPLFNSGNIDDAKKRAKRLVSDLKNYVDRGFEIVYSCPTCGYSLKEMFPVLLETQAARLVSEKTNLLSTYLLALHRAGKLNTAFRETPMKVAYHTPCHLRSQDLSTASLELMSLIPGIELNYLDRGCCGMGGTWAFRSKQQQDISEKVGEELFGEIREKNPQVVTTDCPACQIQIARFTNRGGDQVLHPVRILEKACQGQPYTVPKAAIFEKELGSAPIGILE